VRCVRGWPWEMCSGFLVCEMCSAGLFVRYVREAHGGSPILVDIDTL